MPKISPLYRKSISLNPFPVTDLRPEVELMHLWVDIIVMFETQGIGETLSSLERYLVYENAVTSSHM